MNKINNYKIVILTIILVVISFAYAVRVMDSIKDEPDLRCIDLTNNSKAYAYGGLDNGTLKEGYFTCCVADHCKGIYTLITDIAS